MMAVVCLVGHCAKRREVSGSIADRAVGNFEVTLGSSQPLTEISSKKFPLG
jgi:hypothetical protein